MRLPHPVRSCLCRADRVSSNGGDLRNWAVVVLPIRVDGDADRGEPIGQEAVVGFLSRGSVSRLGSGTVVPG